MSDRDALLRHIIEHPDDDAPRLVMADWLDEHGEPERAEFIRLQCAKTYVAGGHERIAELRQRHEAAWIAELGLPKNRLNYFVFRRGFVREIRCTPKYFLEHGDAIMAAAPIEWVWFERMTLPHTKPLGRHPAFAKIRGLRFWTDSTPELEAAALLAQLPLAGLRTLIFDKRTICEVIMPTWHTRNPGLGEALAALPGLAGLERLQLRHSGMGDAGALALARSPHLGALRALDLSRNAISVSTEAELRGRFGKALILGLEDEARFTVDDLDWW